MSDSFTIKYGEASATFSEGDPNIVLNIAGKHLDNNIEIEQGNATDYGIYFGDITEGTISAETIGREGMTGDITLHTQGAVSDKKIIVKPEFQSAIDTDYLDFSSPNPFTIGASSSSNALYPTTITLQYYDFTAEQWKLVSTGATNSKTIWSQLIQSTRNNTDKLYHLYLRGSGGNNSSRIGGYLPMSQSSGNTTITVTGRLNSLINYQNREVNGKYEDLFSKYNYLWYDSDAGSWEETTRSTRYIKDASQLLMATGLTDSCYKEMFRGCTALIAAPALPATTLASNCYSYMFYGCTALTTAPALPATTLITSCYQDMFRGCTALIAAPALPATTLANSCYSYMFYGCTALTTAPALPATTLASSCYQNMFYGCTSLTTVPRLLATTLADSCYREMFYGCTVLTTLPSLQALTLNTECYYRMFYSCKLIKLSTTQTGDYQTPYCIPTSGNGTARTNALYNMFSSTGGTFKGAPTINKIYYTSNQVI